MITIEDVRREFYGLVRDANNMGMTEIFGQIAFLKFNYFQDGKSFFRGATVKDYLGNPEDAYEDYDIDFSNGTANYIPTLRVNDIDVFIKRLYECMQKYLSFYNFSNAIEKFGKRQVIKNIIITLLSNARYQDYENPIPFLERYSNFFDDNPLKKYDNTVVSDGLVSMQNGKIIVSNYKDVYIYETPYAFCISIQDEDCQYNLPIINYGISNGVCYVYSIQNKRRNKVNPFDKNVKRRLNRVNAGLKNDTDYEKQDTILGTTPSFIVAMTIFFKILKANNINDVRVVTFLPDRYFEKLRMPEYDADNIQRNLTEKMVLLFYRLQHHFPNMLINYPIYDGYSFDDDTTVGDDLVIKIPDINGCDNNKFLNEIVSSLNIDQICLKKDNSECENR